MTDKPVFASQVDKQKPPAEEPKPHLAKALDEPELRKQPNAPSPQPQVVLALSPKAAVLVKDALDVVSPDDPEMANLADDIIREIESQLHR